MYNVLKGKVIKMLEKLKRSILILMYFIFDEMLFIIFGSVNIREQSEGCNNVYTYTPCWRKV